MLKEKSKELYSELITGKYINLKTLNTEDQFVDNLLYLELDKNTHEYEEFYNMIGYDLIHNMEYEYYYLNKQTSTEEDEQELDKNIIKEFVLSVCICRYLFDNKKTMEVLLDPNMRITDKEIDEFLKDSKFETILSTSEINTLTNPINNIFEKRNIFIKNNKGNYVGTNIFKHFIYEQEDLGKKIIQNDVIIS